MGWLRRNKALAVVYGLAAVLAFFELTDAGVTADQEPSPADYLEPGTNIADVSAAVHPGRALSLYYRAQQAAYCSEPGAASHPVCRARGPVRPGEIRELLEAALATGNRSLEEAMYNYAWVLVQEQAPAPEIEAAVEAWRRAHPGSKRSDPRLLAGAPDSRRSSP